MANSEPKTEEGAGLGQAVSDDIAGVQGADATGSSGGSAEPASSGVRADEPAPDAAEIEWAGGVVKKPPAPAGS